MTAFNFDEPSATSYRGALSVPTTSYSGTFNLDDCALPGADRNGDLNRSDRYFGDNISFNQTIGDSVMQHWPDARVTFSRAAENPEFTQPEAAVTGASHRWQACCVRLT